MNVTCGFDQRGRGTPVARGGGPMNRAVGAELCFFSHLFLGRCPGVAPGWYGPGLWPASLRDRDGPRQCTWKKSRLQRQAGRLPYFGCDPPVSWTCFLIPFVALAPFIHCQISSAD